ncbi:MAG: GDP-mannose 4,6-dehydratase, partial [Chloroflexota bacterium]
IWKEFGPLLEELLGRQIPVTYETWRPGDQPIYVSDISKAKADFGWEPRVSVPEGIKRLSDWIQKNESLFKHL